MKVPTAKDAERIKAECKSKGVVILVFHNIGVFGACTGEDVDGFNLDSFVEQAVKNYASHLRQQFGTTNGHERP